MELERLASSVDCEFCELADGLPRLFHFYGVNMRYLGRVIDKNFCTLLLGNHL